MRTADISKPVLQRRNGWLLALLLTPLFMYQADATIVNLANPSIHADLHASGAELELVIGGYLIASATLFITGARIGQLRGYRRAFLAGVSMFGLSSLACGLAPTPAVLIVSRVMQGAGGALMIPQILTGIQLNFEGATRTRALGLYAAALAAGAVAGQIGGGLIVSANLLGAHWRPIFLINVPIAAAVATAGIRILPPDRMPRASQRLDLAGAATLCAALLLILLPLTLGRQAHWPAWAWLCLGASAPSLALFLAVERRVSRHGSPLLNLQMLRRPEIFWGLWPQAIAVSTYYALLFTLALYLQQGRHYSPLVSGLVLVPWVAAFGVPGKLLGRVPTRHLMLVAPIGCLILAGAYSAISAIMFTGPRPVALLLPLLAVGGFGLGMTFSATLSQLTTAATSKHAADISGVFTTSLQVAGAIGIAGFGTTYLAAIGHPGSAGATHAFAIVTAVFALAAVAASATAYRVASLPSGAPGAERDGARGALQTSAR